MKILSHFESKTTFSRGCIQQKLSTLQCFTPLVAFCHPAKVYCTFEAKTRVRSVAKNSFTFYFFQGFLGSKNIECNFQTHTEISKIS